VEARDVLFAKTLIDYFKSQARRVYVGLRGENPDDLLAADVGRFLEERGGRFRDEPTVLYEQLRSNHKGPRADEFSKKLRDIATRMPMLGFGDGHFKKGGRACRYVELTLGIGVNGVNGVNRSNGEVGGKE
jgi:hypothetical protein